MNNKLLIAAILVIVVIGGLVVFKKGKINRVMRYQKESVQEKEATGSMMGSVEEELEKTDQELDALDTNDFGDPQLSNDQIGL